MIDLNISSVNAEFGMIELLDSISQRRDTSGSGISVIILIKDIFSNNLVAYLNWEVPLSGIWNCFWP